MKKGLLGLFILFLLFSMSWDIKDYILGDQLTSNDLESEISAGDYMNLDEVSEVMRESMASKMNVNSTMAPQIFKLQNGNYLILGTIEGRYKASTYLYNGLIETKNKEQVTLTYPDDSLNLVKTNSHFIDKSWDIRSNAGTHHFQSGTLSKDSKLKERMIKNDDGTEGISLFSDLKDGVIQINNGIWLEKGNNKVGMNASMKDFNTEESAINAVYKKSFGKSIGVVKTDNLNFHIYKHQVSTFNEYTVIPIQLKSNQYFAGKFERFTFMQASDINVETEEVIDSITYKLHFHNEDGKQEKYKHQLVDDKLHIGVEVRGEDSGK